MESLIYRYPTQDGTPAVLPSKLGDYPALWTSERLRTEDYNVQFPSRCLREIEGVVQYLRANPLPILVLKPCQFSLDACRSLMDDLRGQLNDGPGFAMLDRLDLKRWSRDEAKAVFWLLGSLLGRPVAQKWNGLTVYDVRDIGNTVQQGVRGSTTNGQLFFHTDNSYAMMPPQYVGLLCLQKSKEGGQSRLVCWGSVYSELQRRHPNLVSRGFRAFLWDRVNEHAPNAPSIMSKPVFFQNDGKLKVCFSSRVIKDGYRMAEQTPDSETVHFIDALDEILNDPRFWIDLQFEPGQIQIINNSRIGHARTAFVDYPSPERKRHLIRLWFREYGRISYNG